jgi:deazaflavin-dependent oxidoreductase (nitroreductase family)
MRLRFPPPSDHPAWRLWELFTRAHIAAYRLTGGSGPIGRLGGAPFLLLHHVGARSGARRLSPLIYLADGERLVIVASKGGTDRHPAWLHNLRAHPETTVEVGRARRPVRAREATKAERERYWPRLDAIYAPYADYRRRAAPREIALVVLEPV